MASPQPLPNRSSEPGPTSKRAHRAALATVESRLQEGGPAATRLVRRPAGAWSGPARADLGPSNYKGRCYRPVAISRAWSTAWKPRAMAMPSGESEDDGRGQRLTITKSGRAMRRRIWPVYAAAIEEAGRPGTCPRTTPRRWPTCSASSTRNRRSAEAKQRNGGGGQKHRRDPRPGKGFLEPDDAIRMAKTALVSPERRRGRDRRMAPDPENEQARCHRRRRSRHRRAPPTSIEPTAAPPAAVASTWRRRWSPKRRNRRPRAIPLRERPAHRTGCRPRSRGRPRGSRPAP